MTTDPQLNPEPLKDITEVAGFRIPEPVKPIEEEAAVESSRMKEDPYRRYAADPTGRNLADVVNYLKPTIDSVLAGYQATGDPQLTIKARVFAAKAVQSYNPEAGASLPTWVTQQLRQLSRAKRQSDNILNIPEGVQLDGYAVYKAEQELEDELGRPPTVDEIADKSNLSLKRIESIRRKLRPVAAESSYETEEGSTMPGASEPDYGTEALQYVHAEGDYIDKMIIEHTTGFGGGDEWDGATLQKRLKLTPVQLSRRRARLAMRIRDITDTLRDVSEL